MTVLEGTNRTGSASSVHDGSPPAPEAAFAIDAAALLSYLHGDEGGAVVQRVLRQCKDCETRMVIPASHLLEAYAAAAREAPAVLDDLISLLDQLPIDVCPLTEEAAEAVAKMVASCPDLRPGLAVALALCSGNGATLVTADPDAAGRHGCLYVGPGRGNPGGQWKSY